MRPWAVRSALPAPHRQGLARTDLARGCCCCVSCCRCCCCCCCRRCMRWEGEDAALITVRAARPDVRYLLYMAWQHALAQDNGSRAGCAMLTCPPRDTCQSMRPLPARGRRNSPRHGDVNPSESERARRAGTPSFQPWSQLKPQRPGSGEVRAHEPLGQLVEKWTLPYATCPRVCRVFPGTAMRRTLKRLASQRGVAWEVWRRQIYRPGR